MQQLSLHLVGLVMLMAVCAAGVSPSASVGQTQVGDATLIAHRYRVGQTPAVRKEAADQKGSPLEARRDLARTQFSEVLPVPPPRGLVVARLFVTSVAERLSGRVVDNCKMTDAFVDCATHYLTPQYPRVFLRLRYMYGKDEVELELGATHRSESGLLTKGEDRLTLEDAVWYQNLFFSLVDLTMVR